MQATKDVDKEVVHVNAAIEHQGPNRQYVVLQMPAKYEGKSFSLLIDSSATHSFLSPSSVCTMKLNPQKDVNLKVELATGKLTSSSTSLKNMKFKLGSHDTQANFRILPLGIYDGILGMDWLTHNHASIDCKNGQLKFNTAQGQEVVIVATRGDPKLQLVTATKLLKAYRKKRMIYAVKLNPVDKPKLQNEPEWLNEFSDVFSEDLTELPP